MKDKLKIQIPLLTTPTKRQQNRLRRNVKLQLYFQTVPFYP